MPNLIFKNINVIIFINLFSCFAAAQDFDSLEFSTELIRVNNEKINLNVFEAPIKIQLINQKEIQNKNGETLGDILPLAGNIFVKSYGGNYSLNTISMNGLGSEQTLVLLDGFKMNSYQNNLIDLNSISKDNIERIEVMNDGLSSLYGSQAIGGVVNVITKKNLTSDWNLKFNGLFGSYDRQKYFFGISRNLGSVNLNLNYSSESAKNDFDYYYFNGFETKIKQRENSDYKNSNYTVNLSYSGKSDFKVSLMSNYSDQFRNTPGIEAGSEPSKAYQTDKNWNSILKFDKLLSNETDLSVQFNFQNNLSGYNDRTIINSYYKNLALSNNSQLNISKSRYRLVSGFEFNYGSLISNEVKSGAFRIQPALYSAAEIDIDNRTKLFPSLRYDYISDINKNVYSGKLGLNFKPVTELKLNLKTSIGNNFAAPTFNELYWNEVGNENLKPESSVNFDAGLICNFDFLADNTIEMTYTYINAIDKIIWTPGENGIWTPENIAKSISNVMLIDAVFKKEISKNFLAVVDFSYCNTNSVKKSSDYENDPSYGKKLFYVPQQLVKLNISLNIYKTGINLFYSFTGKRFTDFENTNFLPACDIVEGNIFQDFKTGKINFRVKLEINNALNHDYQVIAGYPMPLRNYGISVSADY